MYPVKSAHELGKVITRAVRGQAGARSRQQQGATAAAAGGGDGDEENTLHSHLVISLHVHLPDVSTGDLCQGKLTMVELGGGVGGDTPTAAAGRKATGAAVEDLEVLLDASRERNRRQSMLGALLADAFGGNCRTLCIAHIRESCVDASLLQRLDQVRVGQMSEVRAKRVGGGVGPAERAKQVERTC